MFTDHFFPELGGIQDSIATISRALGLRGHQVDIYAPRYGSRDFRRIGLPVRVAYEKATEGLMLPVFEPG